MDLITELSDIRDRLSDRLLEILSQSPGLTMRELSKRTGYSQATVGTALRRLWIANQVMRRTAFEEETPGLRWYVYRRTASPGPSPKEMRTC